MHTVGIFTFLVRSNNQLFHIQFCCPIIHQFKPENSFDLVQNWVSNQSLNKGGDGWMDDMRFYVLLNSILVISGRWKVDNERLCAMELRLWLRRFRPSVDRTRSARSVGQRLTHWATGAPNKGGVIIKCYKCFNMKYGHHPRQLSWTPLTTWLIVILH